MPREITEDTRPIVDTQLEWEADQSGVIHLRKTHSKTEFLDGYGTENFGVSPFETKKYITTAGVLMTSGIASAALLGWKYKVSLITGAEILSTYALLVRESLRE